MIRAFNQDKPYNAFLAEQIAGDELDHVTDDSMIATGFLRSYAKVGYREKDNPQFRYEYLDDMIGTIGRGVLGLTVNCARCHNHKFDPISQKDYYRMQASLFGYVETDYPLAPKEEVEAYEKKTAEIDAKIAPLAAEDPRSSKSRTARRLAQEKYKKYPANVQRAIAIPEDAAHAGRGAAGRAGDPHHVGLERRDRPRHDARRTWREKKLAEPADPRAAKASGPKPLPMAAIVTDGDYRFAPDGPGDEPAPGKGVKREAVEGSFLFKGPGRYQPPPSYFLIRGDVESRGLADEARLHRRDHVRQSAGRRSAGGRPHFGTAARAGRMAGLARRIR